ncbi:hypothetical protein HY972_02915 [Candidatus Kaiserbacteria bacterium]|nr:hypothetical protein [Candidatus Kaiserbacteria bacterium]
MDPEVRRQLEEIHALVKDNHQMLRAIRRHQVYGVVATIIVWLVILITPIYLYQQYLQPFVTKFSATTGIAPSGLFGLPTSADLQKLINSFKPR